MCIGLLLSVLGCVGGGILCVSRNIQVYGEVYSCKVEISNRGCGESNIGKFVDQLRPVYGIRYGLYTATIRPVYGLYTATIRPI